MLGLFYRVQRSHLIAHPSATPTADCILSSSRPFISHRNHMWVHPACMRPFIAAWQKARMQLIDVPRTSQFSETC